MRELGGVVLADGKHNGFAKLATDGVAQAVCQQGFTKQAVGGLREKRFLKTSLLEALLTRLLNVFVSRWRIADGHGRVAQVG